MTTKEKTYKYAMPTFGDRDFTVAKGKGCKLYDEDGNRVPRLRRWNRRRQHRALPPPLGQGNRKTGGNARALQQPLHDKTQRRPLRKTGFGNRRGQDFPVQQRHGGERGAHQGGASVRPESVGQRGREMQNRNRLRRLPRQDDGCVAATAQKKIQKGFAPMLGGFDYAVFNDLASFEKVVDDDTAAVIVEPVQGESGVTPASPKF